MLCGWKLTWFRTSSTLLLECKSGTTRRWVLPTADDDNDGDDGDDDDDDDVYYKKVDDKVFT